MRMSLFDTVSQDIMSAMKAHDRTALDALRNLKKLFLEARTSPDCHGDLSDDQALALVRRLVKQGRDAAALYTEQGRADLAQAELSQVAVMQRYLPRQLSPDELEQFVSRLIAELGATSLRDMGRVMAQATQRLAGQAEGSLVAATVRRMLS